jgi:spore maturation protein CgeB
MGTYSDDRQPKLWQLLLEPARRLPQYRFLVAGPNFPDIAKWPPNTWNVYHLSPREHRLFYLSSRATLNITRKAMIETGYSPSIRLFEAAACGTPIITDDWTGVADFFNVDSEILVARNTDDVVSYLGFSREQLASIGEAGRQRVLAAHTGEKRAAELENYLEECRHSSAAA